MLVSCRNWYILTFWQTCISEMASRVTLQAGRRLLCRSRCLSVRPLSTWRPSSNLMSTQNHRLLSSPNMIRQSASFLHTSNVTSSSHIVTIQDDKDFETRVLHSQKPVIVDFFATYGILFHVTISEACSQCSCSVLSCLTLLMWQISLTTCSVMWIFYDNNSVFFELLAT